MPAEGAVHVRSLLTLCARARPPRDMEKHTCAGPFRAPRSSHKHRRCRGPRSPGQPQLVGDRHPSNH
ncbi:hypothetical protein SCATT_45680 [Streptantibioticus cattleyicolor NRRL 8057 = DSM 46488]|uniref:Uncharacterized protein n=1 Tax=Streptantibioticus cattleyicolor (strain ATCC 35852 / DSM 46488 / JCM 4925 / NBRC 14057 / NRRL 8057) TaxID=1003195 RepID=G8X0M3_STREN|nr:hypothetical protein SCATT_45680 [Streptantibioticus cattleyicolor NRRL 8057 = DSM 46488]